MREIKFRVWDISFKKYLNSSSQNLSFLEDYLDTVDESEGRASFAIQESSLIVQLFTGLKDVDGDEIYEGDILHRLVCIDCWSGKTRQDYKIVEFNPYDGYSLKRGDNDVPFGWLWKIVGNIYENPELIGEFQL